jgi:hypothetical protein
MKFINKLLKPFNIVVQNRDIATKAVYDQITLINLKLLVAENPNLFDNTILGSLLKESNNV